MKNVANFLFEVGMLKRTPRTGFQFLGSGDESVAEHSFRTAMIGFSLASMVDGVDQSRVMKLCLFHDLPEARIGDLNYVNKKYVQVDEMRAVDDLAKTIPFGGEYRELMIEFKAGETLEAQVANDADQIEMILALKEYHDLGNRNAAEWFPYSVKRLKTDAAKELADKIWSTDSSKWWFDDDEDWWVKGKK